ncbi:hypothetical protein L2E82_44359 [Cichorium intybus]|uniref:Uncharacterized protein n=1 Tax=Cichorium intybus TaxID=13427 RepID=A0ACB8ZPB2_CICIN|nr:hypothetical protein L2E82_44359 [Cichorium intybus]
MALIAFDLQNPPWIPRDFNCQLEEEDDEDKTSVLEETHKNGRLHNLDQGRLGFFSKLIVNSDFLGRLRTRDSWSNCSFQHSEYCIKVSVNEQEDVQCPIVEMPTRSKLSCLSWNKHTKIHIASSNYEGIVTVWDVNTRQVKILGYGNRFGFDPLPLLISLDMETGLVCPFQQKN